MIPVAAVPRFSIVLCTRNPRPVAFRRVLAAIANQSSNDFSWEVVVVDSGSTPPLGNRDMLWPAGTRIVRIDQPGIARARIAGVKAAMGEWIVFVDDDNVLDIDYLERAKEIIRRRPEVVLFCGRISGEFEMQPPEWLHAFHRQLAIIDVLEDTWADRWDPSKLPCWTAGMCIRRDIASSYCRSIDGDLFSQSLQRCEDVQLIRHVVNTGSTAGLFRGLHLTHLIPSDRMTVEYLSRIAYETGFNMFVMHWRDHGLSWRDFLRPIKNALVATIKHGRSPSGQIARASALGDLLGAARCLVNPPERAGLNA